MAVSTDNKNVADQVVDKLPKDHIVPGAIEIEDIRKHPEILPLNDSMSRKKSHKRNEPYSAASYQESPVARAETYSPGNSPTKNARLPRQKSDREVLVGTPVKEGHANYMLMYDMLTGIRISVSRCNAKPARDLVEADYTAAHKLAFDVTGNEMTPSSKYDFKFKDYCPWVFRMIRECFHVDANEYLLSLTGKYVLSELVSSGKSGSFFYYSQDYRFIIKTIHHSEHKFMLKILNHYYSHVKNHPHTLLSRIFGLHRVKLPGNKKIHFVVMGNVFPPNKDIHEVYDLKGSTLGREISEEEAKNPRAVMKDKNWMNRNRRLQLGPEKRALFEKQMQIDVKFLMLQGIMDYSLLVGIHDLVRGNQDHIRDQTLSVFEPNADTLSRRATAPNRLSKAQIMRDSSVLSDIVQLGPSTSKLPDQVPTERRYCFFYADEGGFRSTDEKNCPSKQIYYIGIIDIFTYYSPAKRMETMWKSIGHKKNTISAVDPQLYGTRFLDFMMAAIQGTSAKLSDSQNKQLNEVLAIPSGSFIQHQ
ncbi:Phosphatidylinositol-4-phosphate 5-kinase [Boothiomyces sp. JEL0838]|nr:Phosphatidylinositol-4-phosphate 5-kinase [Boothiomyces sp. JEL0838]KAJ3314192.1 Phosphatidylinositol-4-phosphate 5-kinase [Boothiomyces sp. JEL0838]